MSSISQLEHPWPPGFGRATASCGSDSAWRFSLHHEICCNLVPVSCSAWWFQVHVSIFFSTGFPSDLGPLTRLICLLGGGNPPAPETRIQLPESGSYQLNQHAHRWYHWTQDAGFLEPGQPDVLKRRGSTIPSSSIICLDILRVSYIWLDILIVSVYL